MAKEQNISELKEASKALKANAVKCSAWVLETQGLIAESQELGSYTKADDTEIDVVEMKFDNGDVYQVSESRFWKKKN